MTAARLRQETLTKPSGSLRRLEEVSIHLAGIFALPLPFVRGKVIILGAADHGAAAEGVTAFCGAPFFLYLLRQRKRAIF